MEQLERNAKLEELGTSFVIFICNFNLVPDAGRHKYTFLNMCAEDPEIALEDGTAKMFLCSTGKQNDISSDLDFCIDAPAIKSLFAISGIRMDLCCFTDF